jgi:hypothetical protein
LEISVYLQRLDGSLHPHAFDIKCPSGKAAPPALAWASLYRQISVVNQENSAEASFFYRKSAVNNSPLNFLR